MFSRQKSCVPCAKAKRRCEPQTPKCPRCTQRGINCYYKNQPLRDLDSENGSFQPLSLISQAGSEAGSGNVASNREGAQGIGNLSVQEIIRLNTKQIQSPGFHSICPFIVPTSILDMRSLKALTHSVMSWPGKFIRKLEAPYMHSSMHLAPSLPLPLEEAFGACATYASRASNTNDIVMNIIERKVGQVINMNPSAESLETHVAALQAFLILHLVQLWDGDARQRTQAEMHAYILESWAIELHMRAREVSKNQDANPTWDEWIILESARRTAMMTLMAQGVYEMNKYGVCTYVPNLAEMVFTAADTPWEARNLDDWKETVDRPEAIIASYADYATRRHDTTVSPRSTFGKLLLMPCPGFAHEELMISS
ncbi:uncharacterized protein F4822DRAFT_161563 [Hypoxylon trugodes]|uniref:uncharacterized protein n=1 Tax=Hypoxylon trugodes TaxID=326681 RepID=UPI00219F00FA|nr:uncharacterized protein F4822DRAFT_161563 [Hypoxylon trugodes]KAI1390700.1 hypothetical protein F4822DRAFT_161563 [Hypoxylon trugodes]